MSLEAPLAGLLTKPMHLMSNFELTEFVRSVHIKREARIERKNEAKNEVDLFPEFNFENSEA